MSFLSKITVYFSIILLLQGTMQSKNMHLFLNYNEPKQRITTTKPEDSRFTIIIIAITKFIGNNRGTVLCCIFAGNFLEIYLTK